MTNSRYWRQQEIQQAAPAKYRCPCCFRPVAEWAVLCEICKGLSETSEQKPAVEEPEASGQLGDQEEYTAAHTGVRRREAEAINQRRY